MPSGGILTWSGVHGSYTGKEISSQCVATGGGGGIRSVAGNHIVDCSHINTIL